MEKIGEMTALYIPRSRSTPEHRGYTERSDQILTRKAVKVTIPFGDFEFTREYAAPLVPAA